MDTQKSITVKIDRAGRSVIEAHGFNGCGCTEATEQLEIVLGGAGTKKKDYKPEFSMPNTATNNQHAF